MQGVPAPPTSPLLRITYLQEPQGGSEPFTCSGSLQSRSPLKRRTSCASSRHLEFHRGQLASFLAFEWLAGQYSL